jgi:hypothetical protein
VKDLKDLLPQILEKSESRALDWESFDPESFKSIVGPFQVIVRYKTYTGGSKPDAMLFLYDNEGKILDSLSREQGEPLYVDIWHLYQLARRRALRVDEKLDQFEDLLGKL